jgi:hypothetical protein
MKSCRRPVVLALVLAGAATACTPTLDWRDVRPDGAGLVALFPCKPVGHARRLSLAGTSVEMSLFACAAGGATYAVGTADVGHLPLVEPALAQLWTAAARNIGAQDLTALVPLRVEGMAQSLQAGRRALHGSLADGQRVQEQVAVFARGTRVYQATVVGAKLDLDALETFFGALRLPQ